MPPMRVLISGAGIAGPTLAWFLAKTGACVTIIERGDAIRPYGQNIDLKGGALTVIEKMGLLDQVRRFNTTEKGTQFIDPEGQPIAPFPIQEGSAASFSSAFEILRGDLAAILYAATKDHPNVNYLFGTTVKEVVSNGDDSVKVELSDRGVQEFDLLVAADGQWSKLRKQCFPPMSVKTVYKDMYAAYWTIPRLPIDNDWWNVYLALESRIITLRPDPHGTIRAMFTRMPCNDAQEQAWREASKSDRQTQEDLLRKEFADAGWQAERLLDALDQAPDFYFQVIEQVKMTKWSNSRVICLGDAAYAPTSLTGMGTSLAVLGGYLLAGEISKLHDGEHPSMALDAYENRFRSFVEETQRVPSIFPGIFHPNTAWKRWMFQALLRCLAKAVAIPWVANRLGDETSHDNFPLPQYSSLEDNGKESK